MTAIPKILLVPVDGSKGSSAAVTLAAGLAERLNVPIRLLFAFPKSAFEMFGVPSETPEMSHLKYFSPEVFDKLRDDSAAKAFAVAREAMADSTADVQEQVLPGDPAEQILEHAAQESDPMIVMGRRGLSRVKSLLIGSVSQRVSHQAQCPVVLTR